MKIFKKRQTKLKTMNCYCPQCKKQVSILPVVEGESGMVVWRCSICGTPFDLKK